MIGAFSLGQGAPNLESVATARGAAYPIYETIDMVMTFSFFLETFLLVGTLYDQLCMNK